MDEKRLIQMALDCGADGADMVAGADIVMDPAFRAMCEENRCGMYGRCYMCPPDIGPVEELIAKVRSYDRGLLYQTVSPLADSFDIEGIEAAKARQYGLSQRLLDALAPALGPEALHLTVGGCGLCPRCARQEGLPCRHPDRALSSLESYGIDVYNTARGTSLRYINGQNTVTFFGLILFRDADHG